MTCKEQYQNIINPLIPAKAGTQAFSGISFFVYILASRRNGTLYTGSTDDLTRRVSEHKEQVRGGFTARYGVDQPVWWEAGASREGALVRERQIKRWRRAWKIKLTEQFNPGWRDLYSDLF